MTEKEPSLFHLGNFVNIDNWHHLEGNFSDYVASNPLYMHEYGHYLDSQQWGRLYLPVIGLFSLCSQVFDDENHYQYWTEVRANRLAKEYFGTYYGVDWNSTFDYYDKWNNLHLRVIEDHYPTK